MLRLDWNLVFTVLNLLIWYILIRKFLFKPINKVIDQREAGIAARYEEAQKIKAEAEKEKDEYHQLQAKIEEEKASAMTEAQARAQEEYDHILEEADKKAGQILESSKKEASRQKEKILKEAESEIRTIIKETAAEAMKSGSDDHTLYDQFLIKAGETSHAK